MLVFIVIFAFAISSCGKDDSAPEVNETVAAAVVYSLDGEYEVGCGKYDGYTPQTATISITPAGYVFTIKTYTDDACANLWVTTKTTKTVVIKDKASDLYAVDLTYVKTEVTFHMMSDAQALETRWGISGWKNGETRDISGLTASNGKIVPKAGAVYYQSIAFNGTELTPEWAAIGLIDGDGSTPEKRSVRLALKALTKK